ncbi:extracellular tyrosine-protein kinase PKDCC-like [Ptychodera flava]|uniref:extracellular tyrosine-protein kinase PKDCC-like n=1 Tax=Ptychodera flava TaxID=63121 RepID=UPI00396A0733
MACSVPWKYSTLKRIIHRRRAYIAGLSLVLLPALWFNIFTLSPQESSSYREYRLWSSGIYPGNSAVEFEARLTKHVADLRQDLQEHRLHVNKYENFLKQLQSEALEPNIRRLMDVEYRSKFKFFHGRNKTSHADGASWLSALTTKRFSGNGCETLANVTKREPIGIGYTKYVEKGIYKGENLAMKSVALNGHDMTECNNKYMSYGDCLKLANYKLLKEITLLTQLQHTNVIKVSGYCLDDSINKVTIMTELGSPVNIISLLQQSWEDRFRVCLGVSSLLHHLAKSPMGQLGIHDFKLAQFVTVHGEIKLADVDDIDNEEPACKTQRSCDEIIESKTSKTFHLPCVKGRCLGFNPLMNMYNAYRFFFSYLLPFEVPDTMNALVAEVLNNTGSFSWDTSTLLNKMERILDIYKRGEYLQWQRGNQSERPEYVAMPGKDLSGKHDYRCLLSHSGDGCTLTAFDQREGEDLCTNDKECRAFVMTSKKTWSGRTVIYLKNNVSEPQPNADTTLYVRVT